MDMVMATAIVMGMETMDMVAMADTKDLVKFF
jgi:hypothetical protein